MQFLEFFILCIPIRFDYCGYEESLEYNPICQEIFNQSRSDLFGKDLKLLINLKYVDCIFLDRLGYVSLDSCHEERAEEVDNLLLAEHPLGSYQLDDQPA